MHRIDVHNIINAQCYFMFLDVECVEMCGSRSFSLAFARFEFLCGWKFGGRGLWRIMADCGGGPTANIIH